MNRKKSLLLLWILLANIVVSFGSSVQNVLAISETGVDIREREGADKLPKDRNGEPTIVTEVNLSHNNKPLSDTNPIKWGDTFDGLYKLNIPSELSKNIQSEDYFIFPLVEDKSGLKLASQQSDILKNPETKEEMGTYHTNEDGTVTIIFNDKVSEMDELIGEIEFKFEIDKEIINETGPHEVVFPGASQTENEIIYIESNWNSAITKQLVSQTEENGIPIIQWRLVINPNKLEIIDPVITDFVTDPLGLNNNASDYQVDRMVKATVGPDFYAPDYHVTEGDVVEPTPAFDDDGKLRLPSPLTETYVLYVTTPLKSYASGELINHAKLSGSNIKPYETSASVNLGNRSVLIKESNGFDPDTQRVDWTVTYNSSGRYIAEENAFFEDRVEDFAFFVPESLEVSPSDIAYEVTENQNGFKLQFKQPIDQKVVITYQTEIKPEEVGKHESIRNRAFHYNEEVSVEQSLDEGNVKPDPNLPISTIEKEVVPPKKNEKNLTWQMRFNSEKVNVDWWEITDTLTYTEGAIITDSIVLTDITTNQVVSESDYTLEFKNKNHQFILTYPHKTDHEFEINYESTPLIEERWQRNHVVYHYYITNSEGQSEDDAEYYHKKINDLSLSKTGSFVTGYGQVEWMVGVNTSNKLTNEKGKLVDPIPDGQVYVPGSAKVVRVYPHQQTGSEIASEAPVIFNEEKNQLEVTIPSKKDLEYRLIYRATIEDKSQLLAGEVKNIAYYSDESVTDKEVEATLQSQDGSSIFAIKTGGIQTSNPNRLDWKISLNPDRFYLRNVEVLDFNWLNQQIIPETVKITQVTGDDRGRVLVEDIDYIFDYTERAFSIKFNHDVTEEYRIDYQADVLFPSNTHTGQTISVRNGIEVKASNVKIEDGDYSVTIPVIRSDHSGILTGKTKKIRLKKLDEDTKIVLSGAEFTLYRGGKIDKTKIVDRQMTNENGELSFEKLRTDDYLLVETKAPEGYFIDDQLGKGVDITVSSDSPDVIEKEYTNSHTKRITIPVEKKWEGIPLAEAPEITVCLMANGETIDYLKLNIDNNFYGEFNDLPETTLNGNPINYTIYEGNLPYFDVDVVGNQVNGFTITNTKVETLNIMGDKIWYDYNNDFDTRPETIKIILLQNDKEYRVKEISEGENKRWQYSFNDLPKKDMEGYEYTYTVKEELEEPYKTYYETEYNEESTDIINRYIRDCIGYT